MNNNKDFKQIKTVNGQNCIGPCYPPQTAFYNPLYMTGLIFDYPACPIQSVTIDGHQKDADRCEEPDQNFSQLQYDMFDNSVQIVKNDDMFLSQIYQIDDIHQMLDFIDTTLEQLPIYSQRRLLRAIYYVYHKFPEFPMNNFVDKLCVVMDKIYNLKISSQDLSKRLKKLPEDANFYEFLHE